MGHTHLSINLSYHDLIVYDDKVRLEPGLDKVAEAVTSAFMEWISNITRLPHITLDDRREMSDLNLLPVTFLGSIRCYQVYLLECWMMYVLVARNLLRRLSIMLPLGYNTTFYGIFF